MVPTLKKNQARVGEVQLFYKALQMEKEKQEKLFWTLINSFIIPILQIYFSTAKIIDTTFVTLKLLDPSTYNF